MTAGQRVHASDFAGYSGYRVQRVLGIGVTYSSTSIEVLTDSYFLQRARSRKRKNQGARACLYPVYPFTRCPVYPFTGQRFRKAEGRA